ncbi:hypothetical protein [Actinomadura atramentaria]|uniref:hypothetical protein n=1 Tax=Actinomadura atramentaria TaxID=1990 RepID=UPI0003A1321C|nr:hypothetical protein [Actinomadura atramentaria]
MGVLFDYFRAPDGETALRLLDEGDGVPNGPATIAGLDALDAKGIDPHIALGELIGLIRAAPESADLVRTRFLWPPDGTEAQHEGPWLEELDDRIRDALAGAEDRALPSVAEEWVRIEEPGEVDTAPALRFVESLVALARRARQANDHLYCWTCL